MEKSLNNHENTKASGTGTAALYGQRLSVTVVGATGDERYGNNHKPNEIVINSKTTAMAFILILQMSRMIP